MMLSSLLLRCPAIVPRTARSSHHVASRRTMIVASTTTATTNTSATTATTLSCGRHPTPHTNNNDSINNSNVIINNSSRTIRRGFATRRKTKFDPLPSEILDALPVYEEKDVEPSTDPAAVVRTPVTSAHCVDVTNQTLSTLDSVAISPDGSIQHGRYGDLGSVAKTIPLEYLALLRPAAQGAAALRVALAKTKKTKGTVLVFGAGEANGLAAAQLANGAGHAVVAVVGADHSGNDTMMECIKGLLTEPGTAVPEEYALSKKNFTDLVKSVCTGDEGITTPTPQEYLDDFKANFLDYSETYPETRSAAVGEDIVKFNYMEKDREYWEENMDAFLAQYTPGAPPVDKAKLDAFFSTEQYEIFRQKFWKQTSAVISGDDPLFSAAHIVKHQSEAPEELSHTTQPGAGPEYPYSFSVLNQFFPEGTAPKAGGDILGAVIAVTPDLKIAAETVAKAKTLREKGEALQFLTHKQRAAFTAACSVAAQAQSAGAPVVVMGENSADAAKMMPGLDTVGEPTEADVKEALEAMDIDDDGESKLNYFIQVYRANDFPFYGDYAVHRASEVLAGPRQIIVTK